MTITNEAPGRTKAELFSELEEHLLGDSAPSVYLKEKAATAAWDAYPFSLLKKLDRTPQSPVHHPEGNVWNHTLLVVDEAAKRRSESHNPRAFMWSALLHDIGKPATTRIRGEKITAYNHDKVGAELACEFLSLLTDDEKLVDKVTQLVKYHMQLLYVVKTLPFMNISGMKRDTDIREVALLGLCDRLGRKGANIEDEVRQVHIFIKRCSEGQKGDHFTMAKAGMRRPDPEAPHGESSERNHFSKNEVAPVPELQGKAKFTKDKAKPIIYKNEDGSNRSV